MTCHFLPPLRAIAAAAAALLACAAAGAATVRVTVTANNLAPANSIAFAPLHLGFNNGSYDAFNKGDTPGAAIISVAEGGAGGAWQAAFGAADPSAVRGTITPVLTPGASSSLSFDVDTAVNPFFTFAAMVVPSNDFFIGNDAPTAFRLFDAGGNLLINSIGQTASQIWDAGSEVFDPAAAAFVGNNDLRAPQNSVVSFNFAEFYGYNGLTTGANYVFNAQLAAATPVYRIDFAVSPVPEPASVGLFAAGAMGLGFWLRRRRGSDVSGL